MELLNKSSSDAKAKQKNKRNKLKFYKLIFCKIKPLGNL